MKAMVFTQYGAPDVLQLKEIPMPTPKENEVLVRVMAASVNAADWHLLRGDPFLLRLNFGLLRPKLSILGADIAGKIEVIGNKVKQFKVGDEVFADISGFGFGAFAEFICVPEQALVHKPSNLSFVQAAAVPMAAVTALQGLRDHGKIRAGQKVLIHGASGGVGTFAVQLAKTFGADVTAVCSTQKLELAKSLGADKVIDYSQEDFTKNGQRYDLILAVNGNRSILEYKKALSPNGISLTIGGAMSQLMQAIFWGSLLSLIGKQKMGSVLAKPNIQDLAFIRDLIMAGKISPVVDKTYSFQQIPEAIRYLETGKARGKVVIHIGDNR